MSRAIVPQTRPYPTPTITPCTTLHQVGGKQGSRQVSPRKQRATALSFVSSGAGERWCADSISACCQDEGLCACVESSTTCAHTCYPCRAVHHRFNFFSKLYRVGLVSDFFLVFFQQLKRRFLVVFFFTFQLFDYHIWGRVGFWLTDNRKRFIMYQ